MKGLRDCHNSFLFDLDDQKNKKSRHRYFLYGCDLSSDRHGSKLESQNPNSKRVDWSVKQTRDSKLGDSVMREEGFAPSQRPF